MVCSVCLSIFLLNINLNGLQNDGEFFVLKSPTVMVITCLANLQSYKNYNDLV